MCARFRADLRPLGGPLCPRRRERQTDLVVFNRAPSRERRQQAVRQSHTWPRSSPQARNADRGPAWTQEVGDTVLRKTVGGRGVGTTTSGRCPFHSWCFQAFLRSVHSFSFRPFHSDQVIPFHFHSIPSNFPNYCTDVRRHRQSGTRHFTSRISQVHRRRDRAMAQTPTCAPAAHVPLAVGSTAFSGDTPQLPFSTKFLGILDQRCVRRCRTQPSPPSIIVGFPGKGREDFQATRRRGAGQFSSAFTFQYSPRPGTPAATMDDQVPPEVVSGSTKRLIALRKICLERTSA